MRIVLFIPAPISCHTGGTQNSDSLKRGFKKTVHGAARCGLLLQNALTGY